MKAVRALYERNVLVESFCTERDDILRKTDRPERYIETLPGRSPPNDEERLEEAEWISRQLLDNIVV